jgi:hypothetical protein
LDNAAFRKPIGLERVLELRSPLLPNFSVPPKTERVQFNESSSMNGKAVTMRAVPRSD